MAETVPPDPIKKDATEKILKATFSKFYTLTSGSVRVESLLRRTAVVIRVHYSLSRGRDRLLAFRCLAEEASTHPSDLPRYHEAVLNICIGLIVIFNVLPFHAVNPK